ncbi:MAG: carbamoyltransferase C-terminal domain-containing protein [Caldilineaceae bacterium]
MLNTSFNENEPIVCTPDEAGRCLLRTKMDALAFTSWAHSAIGNFWVEKEVGLAG